MANIKSVLSLQDNMSKTLSKIEKQTIANIQAFNKLEKQQQSVVDQMAKLSETGQSNSVMMEQLKQVNDSLGQKMNEYADGSRQAELANDKLNTSMTEVNQTLEIAQKAWNLLSKAIQEATKWMEMSDKQFNAEYTSAVKMHGVLGASSKEISSMYEYASALQKVGVVGDEATLSGMSTLTMYASNVEQVKKLTPAILDLAVAENGLETSQANVESTAQKVGYALNGNATMLKRMIGASDKEIKKLNSITDKNKRAEYLFELLEKRVGGVNETLAETAQGGMVQANNALGDLQEILGKQVVPYFAAFKQILVDILTPIVEFVEANSDWLIPSIVLVIGAVGSLIAILTIQKTVALLTAGANWAMVTPLLVIITILGIVIGVVVMVNKQIEKVGGTTLNVIGVITGSLAVMATFVQNVFIDLYNIIMGVTNGISLLFIGLAEIVIGVVNVIAKAIDAVFGSNLSSATQGLIDKLDVAGQDILQDGGYLDRKDYNEAFTKGYDFGEGLSDKFKIDASGASMGNLEDWISNIDNINTNLGGLIGTDSTGGKALKTTSNDNLLSDEDIQLLLDVATRDYQLSYQQITPNVTVNFGDVRETADVDQVLDVVGTRIEELIYGDAEVVY